MMLDKQKWRKHALTDRQRIPTHELKRKLPEWAKVERKINGIEIYNMSILDNIMSWTYTIPNVPAID